MLLAQTTPAASARAHAARRPWRTAHLSSRTSRKVAVSEPKIADAVVISPREIMVNAKGPGRATLVIWETGAEPARYEMYVTKDTTEWDSFTKAINDSAGAPSQRDRHAATPSCSAAR